MPSSDDEMSESKILIVNGDSGAWSCDAIRQCGCKYRYICGMCAEDDNGGELPASGLAAPWEVLRGLAEIASDIRVCLCILHVRPLLMRTQRKTDPTASHQAGHARYRLILVIMLR